MDDDLRGDGASATCAETPVRAPPVGTDLRFAAFTVMWALANGIHLANQSFARIDNPAGWVNLVAVALVLGNPRSVRRLALLAVTQLAEVVWVAPLAPDHAMLAAAVNIAVLLGVLRTRRSSGTMTPDATLDRIAAPARLILLFGYSAAAIAKYNSAFLDPAHSCATFLANYASFGLTGDVAALRPLFIVLSVGAETLVALLLIIPATRRIGARVGIVFHFLVSLSPLLHVGDYSATLWPLFLLFLPADEFGVVAASIRDSLGRSAVVAWVRWVDRRLAGVVVVAMAGAAGWLPGTSDLGIRIAISLMVSVYGTVIVAGVIRRTRSAGRARLRYRPSPGQGALLLLVVVWAFNRISGSGPPRRSRCSAAWSPRVREPTICSCRACTWSTTRTTSSRCSDRTTATSSSWRIRTRRCRSTRCSGSTPGR